MRNLDGLISSLTTEEKARICCGEGFWNSTALPEHGIHAINLTDGPHGVRKQAGAADHLGLMKARKPPASLRRRGLPRLGTVLLSQR
jgi:beta-glucosidase